MLDSHQVEELIRIVSAMSRQTVIERLLSFRGAFPVDFTNEFLSDLPLERLHHLFLALCLQSGRFQPEEIPTAA